MMVGDIGARDVVATTELITATEDEYLDTVLRRMHAFVVRRVPAVAAAGELVGLRSLDAMTPDAEAIVKLVGEQREFEREPRQREPRQREPRQSSHEGPAS